MRAEAQAEALERLAAGAAGAAGFALSDDEAAWVKRGRNVLWAALFLLLSSMMMMMISFQATSRRGPLRLRASVYADASGLECLVGFLYLADQARCRALLDALAVVADEAGAGGAS